MNKRAWTLIAIATAVVVGLTDRTARAGSYTWANTGNGSSGYWTDPAMWSPSSAYPSPGDSAYLTNPIASGAYTCVYDYTPGLGGALSNLALSSGGGAGQACLIVTNASLATLNLMLGNGGVLSLDTGGTLVSSNAVTLGNGISGVTGTVTSASAPGAGGSWNLTGKGLTIGSSGNNNALIVTNVGITGGTLTIGNSGAKSNIVSAFANSTWNLLNNGILIGYNGGNLYGNSLAVNGGTLTNVNSIGIGQAVNANTDIRYNTLAITNGGRVFVNGAVNVAYTLYSISGRTLNSNSLVIADGGYLASIGGGLVPNNGYGVGQYNTMTVLGGGGAASVWNLGGGGVQIGAGSYNTVTIDGAGVAGSAVLTNAAQVAIYGTTNSLLLTNGARMFSTNTVTLGYDNSADTMTIAGGAAHSMWNVGGATFYVGYSSANVYSNQLVIGAGGVVTNVGSLQVGREHDSPATAYNNSAVVTDGGQLFTVGSILIGRAEATAFTAASNAKSNVVVITAGGVVNAGGGLYVGSSGYLNGQNASYNSVIVTNGGQLFTKADSYIGVDAASYAATFLNNNVTIVGSRNGTNATWDLGGAKLYVGSVNNGSSVATGNVLTVSDGGVVTNLARLVVAATNAVGLLPGGMIYANVVTNKGAVNVVLDDTISTVAGQLAVSSNLNITGCALSVRPTKAKAPAYVIATYGTLTGTFATTNGLTDGWRVKYAEGSTIVLIPPAGGSVMMVE